MRAAVISIAVLCAMAACSTPPSYTPEGGRDCGGPVETQIGGDAQIGAGSNGFISDTDIVFSTRITPGSAGCTSVGGSYGIS